MGAASEGHRRWTKRTNDLPNWAPKGLLRSQVLTLGQCLGQGSASVLRTTRPRATPQASNLPIWHRPNRLRAHHDRNLRLKKWKDHIAPNAISLFSLTPNRRNSSFSCMRGATPPRNGRSARRCHSGPRKGIVGREGRSTLLLKRLLRGKIRSRPVICQLWQLTPKYGVYESLDTRYYTIDWVVRLQWIRKTSAGRDTQMRVIHDLIHFPISCSASNYIEI